MRAAICGLLVTTASTAFAQDVVMRRPLPASSTASSGTPTPSPSTPTPTPPSFPDYPDPADGLTTYGYLPDCTTSAYPDCLVATFSSGGYSTSTTDASNCHATLSADQVSAAYYAGLIPGGPGVTGREICSQTNLIYGYYETCTGTGYYYQCSGFDPKTGVLGMFPESTCRAHPASQSDLDALGMSSQQVVDSQVDVVGCGGTITDPPTTSPGGVTSPPQDPSTLYDWQWSADAWSGTAQCGTFSTLTRNVTCTRYEVTEQGRINPVEDTVDQCESFASNARPEAIYTGTGAGCSYHTDTTGDPNDLSQWVLPVDAPAGDTVGCSSVSYYQPNVVCVRDSDNATVDPAYCEENYVDGGERSTAYDRRVGNHSLCVAEWKLILDPAGPYCDGNVLEQRIEDTACVKNGQRLTGADEAACPADDRPLSPSVRAVGTCKTDYWDLGQYNGDCMGGTSMDSIVIPNVYSGSDWDGNYNHASPSVVATAKAFCESENASCCSIVQAAGSAPNVWAIQNGQVNLSVGAPNGVNFYSVSMISTRQDQYTPIDPSLVFDPDQAPTGVN